MWQRSLASTHRENHDDKRKEQSGGDKGNRGKQGGELMIDK
jgi:hypothetical protein